MQMKKEGRKGMKRRIREELHQQKTGGDDEERRENS